MKIIHKMLLYSFKMLYWWWSVQDVGCRILYMYSVNTLANNVTSLTSLYYMCAMMANITMTIPRNQDSPQFWGYMIALAISLIQIVRPTPHPAWLLFFKKIPYRYQSQNNPFNILQVVPKHFSNMIHLILRSETWHGVAWCIVMPSWELLKAASGFC